MPLTTVQFTRTTFAELLRLESRRCVQVAVARGWLAGAPEPIVYYFPSIDDRREWSADGAEIVVPRAAMLMEEELMPHLFREEDVFFRSEIGLAPFAVTEKEIAIEASLREAEWTNQVLEGKYASLHEPFQLRGPAVPHGWKDGDPVPPLRRLRVVDPLR